MKTKIKILNRWTRNVIFTIEAENLREALVEAVTSGADLSGANLFGANLFGADLSGANLFGADLFGANLFGANLFGANLSDANLSDANLSDANLSGANLSGANLSDANLSGANLSDADLSGANLSGADLSRANLSNVEGIKLAIARTRILPDGDLIGWKKCPGNVLVKLRIPADARRSHASGRKCRAERAEVLEVIGAEEGISGWDERTVYRVGETVSPVAPFDLDWREECASGIHFYITREEAEAHG